MELYFTIYMFGIFSCGVSGSDWSISSSVYNKEWRIALYYVDDSLTGSSIVCGVGIAVEYGIVPREGEI